jgi:hypothetical protein
MFDASLSSNLSIRNHLPNFRRINHIALFWEETIVTIDSKWFFYSLILDGLSSIFLPFFLTKPTVKPPFPLALEGSVPVRPWRTQAVVAALAVGMQRAATRQHAFAAQAWHCHTWNPRNPCVLRILKNKKKHKFMRIFAMFIVEHGTWWVSQADLEQLSNSWARLEHHLIVPLGRFWTLLLSLCWRLDLH